MRGPNSLLRDAIRARPRDLTVGTALLTLHQACEALVPVMAGVVIDEAVGTGDTGALVWTMALLAVLFVVLSNAFRFGYRRTMLAAEHAEHELRMRMVERVFGGAESRPAGELVSLATSDAGRVAAIAQVVGFGGGVLSAVLGRRRRPARRLGPARSDRARRAAARSSPPCSSPRGRWRGGRAPSRARPPPRPRWPPTW